MVASREEPTLPLARWRAKGWIHELGVPVFGLDEQEAGLLLEGAGVELDPSEVTELRADGGLACRSCISRRCRSGPDAPRAPRLRGDDRFIPTPSASSFCPVAGGRGPFLKHTSVLDRLSGDLAMRCWRRRVGAVLEALALRTARRAAGPAREWYRYHHLFRELLRNELEHTEPTLVPALNARAMDWCVANDLPEEAIGYGQAAGETDTVAGLIDALSPPYYYDGRLQTVEHWLGWFGDDELVQYPSLARLWSLVACADRASRGC